MNKYLLITGFLIPHDMELLLCMFEAEGCTHIGLYNTMPYCALMRRVYE
jgi:hypothetical protein